MKKFPSTLGPNNKESFKQRYHDRLTCYLRKEIYEHILSHEEREYFSLDNFIGQIGDREIVKKIIQEIMVELRSIGWNCKTSYGGTGLFIYSTENPPSNCFEDM
jgi:hypothetical protein